MRIRGNRARGPLGKTVEMVTELVLEVLMPPGMGLVYFVVPLGFQQGFRSPKSTTTMESMKSS